MKFFFNIFLVLLDVGCWNLGYSQGVVNDFIRQGIHEVKSIDPSYTDNSDLYFLDSAFLGKRIIFLGESKHSDGLALEAKSRLIKYMVENLHYELIVFERNVYEMDKMFQLLRTKKYNPRYVLMEGFKWRDFLSVGNENLFSIIQSNIDKIKLAGIEISYGSWYFTLLEKDLLKCSINKRLVSRYVSLLSELNILASEEPDVQHFNFQEFEELTREMLQLIGRNKPGQEATDFLVQVVASNSGLAKWVRNRPPLIGDSLDGSQVTKNFEIRDKYLPENLLWLLTRKYPGKKVIVSTSTLHMSRGLSEVPVLVDHLPDSLRAISYYLPIISYQGKTGFETDIKMFSIYEYTRDVGSVEHVLHSLDMKYCFADFKSMTEEGTRFFNTLSMHPSPAFNTKAEWCKIYDGVFFIDTMSPDQWKPLKLRDYEYLENVLYKHKERSVKY